MARRLIIDTGVLIAPPAVATKRTVLTTDRGANFNDLPDVDCIVVT